MAFVPFRLALSARQSGRSRSTLRSGTHTSNVSSSTRPVPNSSSRGATSNINHNTAPATSARPASPALNGESTAPNLTRHATGGLKALYERIRLKGANDSATSESHTRPDGHLLLSERLPLLNNRYRVVSGVGEGTFSQLLLAEDTFTQHKRVALKVMNSKYSFIGLQEVEKLCWLNTRDTHCQSHIVRLLGAFYFQQHLCLVLELLGTSLLNYMKQQSGGRVPMDVVRKIAWQLCTSLAFVGSCNMIHGDIKVSDQRQRAICAGHAVVASAPPIDCRRSPDALCVACCILCCRVA